MKVKVYTQAEFERELGKALRKEKEEIGKKLIDRLLHVLMFAVWDSVPEITTEELHRVLEVVEEKALYIYEKDIDYDDIKRVLKEEANLCISYQGGN